MQKTYKFMEYRNEKSSVFWTSGEKEIMQTISIILQMTLILKQLLHQKLSNYCSPTTGGSTVAILVNLSVPFQ